MKNLHLSKKEFVPRFASFTQELVEGGLIVVLSALQNLFLEEHHPSGPAQEAIWEFKLLHDGSRINLSPFLTGREDMNDVHRSTIVSINVFYAIPFTVHPGVIYFTTHRVSQNPSFGFRNISYSISLL